MPREIDSAVTVPAQLEWLTPPRATPSDPSQPRYALLEKLGEGGMGEVRLCVDRRIGRQVAMKVMRSSQVGRRDMRVRFLREALVQGQLEHPAVVPVYDVATGEDGIPQFTMMRVHGVTLEDAIDLLRDGDEPALKHYTRHKLLTAFGSVCQCVHLAHRRGVLHRDLKPTNIMLGDFGEVYVLDWGLAKLRGEAQDALVATDESVAAGQTELGAVMGTPGYISPEQLRQERVDEQSDVYALGSILFEILALKPLHDGESPSAICGATQRGADARCSVRAPERDVPPELEAICVRATAQEPAARFASAGDLYDALERFLEGDRDVARRRQMAAEYAMRARATFGTSRLETTAGTTTLSEAIRDLGRALALDPQNVDAADALVGLLTERPATMPEEATEEILAEDRRMQRVRTRVGSIAFFFAILLVPLWMWMGVRSWPAVVAAAAACFAGGVSFLRLYRHPRRDGTSPWFLPIVACLAAATMSAVVGPLLLVPAVASVLAVGLSLGASPRRPYLPLALCVLSMLGPFALELVGVLPPSYSFESGAMCALPRMVLLPRVPTYAFIVIINLVAICMGAYFGVSLRRAFADAHRGMRLHAWQLRQLIPQHARSALSTAPRASTTPGR